MKPGPSTDERVLIDAFREHRAGLWHFFLKATGAREVAEDLLQETFLRAWDHREKLAVDSPAAASDSARRYIWRVARNLLIDEIRARQRLRARTAPSPREDEPEREPTSPTPGPADEIEHADCLRVVREVIQRLPSERSRQCLRLWLEDADVLRIAEETGLRAGQVRGLLQRAKSETIRRAAEQLGLAEPDRGGDGS